MCFKKWQLITVLYLITYKQIAVRFGVRYSNYTIIREGICVS